MVNLVRRFFDESFFPRYGSLSFGEVVNWVPQKLDKVKIASVRRLAIREAVKVCFFQRLCSLNSNRSGFLDNMCRKDSNKGGQERTCPQ